jgi:Icc-related predicted phosphoesterase
MLFGIGWSGGMYYDLPTEYDIEKVIESARRELILKSKTGDVFIILTHYPPWIPLFYPHSNNPAGWMFSCIQKLMDEIKPMVVLQGHVHELAGNQFIYNGADFKTLVVSPGPDGGILSIDKESMNASFEFNKK